MLPSTVPLPCLEAILPQSNVLLVCSQLLLGKKRLGRTVSAFRFSFPCTVRTQGLRAAPPHILRTPFQAARRGSTHKPPRPCEAGRGHPRSPRPWPPARRRGRGQDGRAARQSTFCRQGARGLGTGRENCLAEDGHKASVFRAPERKRGRTRDDKRKGLDANAAATCHRLKANSTA